MTTAAFSFRATSIPFSRRASCTLLCSLLVQPERKYPRLRFENFDVVTAFLKGYCHLDSYGPRTNDNGLSPLVLDQCVCICQALHDKGALFVLTDFNSPASESQNKALKAQTFPIVQPNPAGIGIHPLDHPSKVRLYLQSRIILKGLDIGSLSVDLSGDIVGQNAGDKLLPPLRRSSRSRIRDSAALPQLPH